MNDLITITEDIQKECHGTVNEIFNNSKSKDLIVQDAVNVFFYRKLAEMELRLRALEK